MTSVIKDSKTTRDSAGRTETGRADHLWRFALRLKPRTRPGYFVPQIRGTAFEMAGTKCFPRLVRREFVLIVESDAKIPRQKFITEGFVFPVISSVDQGTASLLGPGGSCGRHGNAG